MAAPELPSGTVTFLFTDIEGSTRLLKHLGEAYGALLSDHRRILRDAAEARGGREIDTQGDSFFFAFARANAALAAAVLAQRALAEHDWPEGAQVRVRMGLHTAEPTVGEERYIGLGVHRAARIGAVAHGGQVLLSSATRELVEDEVGGVSVRELGSYRLKDIDRPERIFQLDIDGLQTMFPPLRAERVAEPRKVRRRTVFAGALAGVIAAAVAVPIFAVGSGGGSGLTAVAANAAGLVESPSGRILAQVPVGGRPAGIAVGEGGVWVTDSVDNMLLRIDPSKRLVVDRIPVGADPSAVAVGGGAVWVANSQDGTVSRVNPRTDTVVGRTLRVGNGPTALAFGEGSLWVLNSVDATVTRIRAITGEVEATILLAQNPSRIAYGLGSLWVTSEESGLLLRVDTTANEVVQALPVGNGPVGVAVGGGAVWVANVADRTVSRIDPGSGAVSKIDVPAAPQELAYGTAGLWSGDTLGATVTLIDARTDGIRRTTPIGTDPDSLAENGRQLWVGTVGSVTSHRGGTLRVLSQGGDTFDSIDPGAAFREPSWQVLTTTNDGLLAFRHAGGPAGLTLVPDLATSLPVIGDGGRTYSFQLRTGIRYSNGRLVRAKDFRYALERELQAGTGFAYSKAQLVGAARCSKRACNLSHGVVTDDAAGTIVFHLVQPDPDFVYELALPQGDAVPVGAPRVDVGSHPLPATGPYRISRFVPDKQLVLVRNPYFRQWSSEAQPDGFPDRIVWRFGLDPSAETSAVEQGRADVMVDSPPSGRLREIALRFPAQAHPYVDPATYYLFLNTHVRPFSDARARRAVSMAIDRGTVVRLWGGTQLARPTCQMLPPGIGGYRPYCPYTVGPNASGAWRGANLTEGRQLVAASGTKGTRVVVRINADDPARLQISRYLVGLLRRLGYASSLRTYPDTQTYYTQIGRGSTRAQIGLQGWESNFPRASDFFTNLFTCSSYTPTAPFNINDAGFCDHRIDRQIERAEQLQISRPADAAALWAKVDHEIVDRSPAVFLFNRSGIDLTSARTGNYQRNKQLALLLDQLWVR